MVHDFWMHRDDPAFVHRHLPGTRTVLDWFIQHQRVDGLIGLLPWWTFVDWTDDFADGVPPQEADDGSAPITLQFMEALGNAADLEQGVRRCCARQDVPGARRPRRRWPAAAVLEPAARIDSRHAALGPLQPTRQCAVDGCDSGESAKGRNGEGSRGERGEGGCAADVEDQLLLHVLRDSGSRALRDGRPVSFYSRPVAHDADTWV
jgi:hypothetical protein